MEGIGSFRNAEGFTISGLFHKGMPYAECTFILTDPNGIESEMNSFLATSIILI